MDTAALKKFAQVARRQLREQVTIRLEQVLNTDSAELREKAKALEELQREITKTSKEAVIAKVSYTWFNRFCALRFMDVNRYTRIAVVSPAEGQSQPEILAEAKMGQIDEDVVNETTRQQIFALLDGSSSSHDPQAEAYRLLLVAACNDWHRAMPFLFEHIEDYTELLMPEDLLSENSILAQTREVMTPDACKDVEVIGWLYQFYISEKKDEVFAGLKKNQKVTPENIPAATQLFTPHWIVRYLAENSLGRLWMLNRPDSKLVEKMDYYIKPEQPETDFLRIECPEEIKICDPACGSGHMLTYAFDLLYAIYEEEGYEPAEIPTKILTYNLYGIEIDERAGELAAFALTMKARSKQRRFFRRPVQPHICVLENVQFKEGELKDYMNYIGRDLFTAPLQTTLRQFEEADNFGSLIRPDVTKVAGMLDILEPKDVSGNLFLSEMHQRVLRVLRQADYLSSKYHVVIANPPYMGRKGMNERLSAWVKDNYPKSKSDLFGMFIERNLDLAQKHGVVAMITMQSWMFLSSFEVLRARLLGQHTLLSMAHLGVRAFDSIGGEVVSTTAFVLENTNHLEYKGAYLRLVSGNSEAEKNDAIREAVKNPKCGWLYSASATDFKKIPGSPIVYWVSKKFADSWDVMETIEDISISDGQNKTGDNGKFLRFHWELDRNRFLNSEWITYAKGGPWRKWFGNTELLIDWSDEARCHYRKDKIARLIPEYLWYKRGLSWSFITAKDVGFRYLPEGGTFDVQGSTLFFTNESIIFSILALLNSKPVNSILRILNPTISLQVKDVRGVPIPDHFSYEQTDILCNIAIRICKSDWDNDEAGLDFTYLPLLNHDYRESILEASYQKLRIHWQEMTLEMQQVEEKNNRIFIDAYGLQNELTSEVPINEITLTCNPHYRYGGDKCEEELEALLLNDTMRELISYAVGCMFGRYALEEPGLILANQGETFEDYLKRVPEPSFPADDDNVIPLLDGDWFADDIVGRFQEFMRVTFGTEHYEENLNYIEMALGKSIRKYFLKDFYNDHVRRYKKRPIYWLFSSPKGSFNALIYMHRYRPDTVSVVLNDYLREFRTKLASHLEHQEAVSISVSASQREKTQALKEVEKIKKIIEELEDYEREILYPLAAKQIDIDLDDGVKVNYPKFGKALKKVAGLS